MTGRGGEFHEKICTHFMLAIRVLSYALFIHAQEALWKEPYSKVLPLYQQGRYEEASKVAEEALHVAEKTFGPNHPHVAVSLNGLGELYRAQGKCSEAEPLHNRSLEIFEKAVGPELP